MASRGLGTRWLRRWVVLGTVALLSVGCTALLGDFEVTGAPDSGTTTEGGADGPAADGTSEGSTDAGVDANEFLLTCGAGQIRELDVVTDAGVNGGGYDRFLRVFRAGSFVRVFFNRRGVGGLTAIDFDPKGGGPPMRHDFPMNNGVVLDGKRQGGQAQVSFLVIEPAPSEGGPLSRMAAYQAKDGNFNALDRVPLSDPFTSPNDNRTNGSIGIYANDNEYYWAISRSVGNGNTEISVGHKIPNQNPPPATPAITAPSSSNLDIRDIARSASSFYIFNTKGPEAGDPKGGSVIKVPETIPNPGTPLNAQPKDITPPGGKPLVTLAVTGIGTGDGLRGAVAEVDFSGGGGNIGALRIGTLSEADLAAIDGTKLPVGFGLTSLLEAPVGSTDPRLLAEDFLWIGSPPEPLKGQGLNFIWFDHKNRVMRGKQVHTSRLLLNRTNITNTAITFAGPATGVSGDFDVVWEEDDPGSGKKGVFYTNVSCVK